MSLAVCKYNLPCGVVIAGGADQSGGDMPRQSCYAHYVIVPAQRLVPDALSALDEARTLCRSVRPLPDAFSSDVRLEA